MNRATELSIAFLESHPDGAARVLDGIRAEDAATFVEEVPETSVVTVLGFMQPARAAAVLERVSPDKAGSLLSKTPAHARTLLLRALPEEIRKETLSTLPKKQAASMRRYLAYGQGTVGAWMDPANTTFAADTRVEDCLRRVRELGRRLGSFIFVIDADRRLRGSVRVDRLLTASDDALLGDLMDREIARLSPQASLSSVITLRAWDAALSLPVADRSQRLVGVLHFDSLREGLVVDRGPTGGLQVNVMLTHLAQAFLVSLSGLMNVATAAPASSRLEKGVER